MAVAAAAPCANLTQLYQAIFPDQVYSHTRDQRARLAAELRRTAELLDPGHCLSYTACDGRGVAPLLQASPCALRHTTANDETSVQLLQKQTTSCVIQQVGTVHVGTLALHPRHGLHLRSDGRMVKINLIEQSGQMCVM
jgi:hypothetical protein